MGYGQWLHLSLYNHTSQTLTVRNLYVHHGKLYTFPDKAKSLSPYAVNNCDIHPGQTLSFSTCGTENSSQGAEGDFGLYFKGVKGAKEERMCQIYWDCPFQGPNKLQGYFVKQDWFVCIPEIDTSGGIGKQTITILTTTDPITTTIPERTTVPDLVKLDRLARPAELKRSAPSKDGSVMSVDSAIAV